MSAAPMLRRLLLRPASAAAGRRSISTTAGLRASVGDAPPGSTGNKNDSNTYAGSAASKAAEVLRELGVGELEGAQFKIEPMRRVGEDEQTMRARLTYQSRKRGTLESDLLLSTFADEQLPHMTKEQMTQYDLFLDENDWDIYYWATQEPPSSSPAEAAKETAAAAEMEAKGEKPEDIPARPPGTGEWAQTVGTFKPAYRPVPARWRDSEILGRLRDHVQRRAGEGKGGMAFMPRLKT